MQLPRLHDLENGFIADIGRPITVNPNSKMIFICLDINSVNGPEDVRHLPAKVITVSMEDLILATRLTQVVLKEIAVDSSSDN